jgi:protein-tyrosine-phosphatase
MVRAMSAKKSVLFVCTGNTCRSPMAEGLFRQAVETRGDFEVASAGVAAYPGDAANPETVKFLEARGIALDGFASQPVAPELLEKATHVFVEIPGRGVAADVPDPIGMGRKAYEETGKTLDLAIPTIISFIDQTWQG